jgi:hypothetical protein
MKLKEENLKALYLLDGTRIKTLVLVPPETRVLVASMSKTFIGIEGLDKIEEMLKSKSSKYKINM